MEEDENGPASPLPSDEEYEDGVDDAAALVLAPVRGKSPVHKLALHQQAWIIERYALGDSTLAIMRRWPSDWDTVALSSVRYYRRRYKAEIEARRKALAAEVPYWGAAAKSSQTYQLIKLNDLLDDVIATKGLVWTELVKAGREIREQDAFADKLVDAKLKTLDQLARLLGHYPRSADGQRVQQAVVVNIPVMPADMPQVEVQQSASHTYQIGPVSAQEGQEP